MSYNPFSACLSHYVLVGILPHKVIAKILLVIYTKKHGVGVTCGQVVVAISGFYLGLYGLSKVLSAVFSSPKKEVGKSPPPPPLSPVRLHVESSLFS